LITGALHRAGRQCQREIRETKLIQKDQVIGSRRNTVQLMKFRSPDFVEGLWVSGWWFDKLTTNG